MIVAYCIYHSRAGGMCLHIKIIFGPTNAKISYLFKRPDFLFVPK
jgi:hypothetical protein